MSWRAGVRYFLAIVIVLFCIFRLKLEPVMAPRGNPSWSLMALGDVMLAEGRNAGRAMAKHGTAYPFAKIASLTRKATLTFANLECPIAASGSPFPGKQLTFRASPQAADALVSAGIDVVSLANNHILDYNEEALRETKLRLKQKKIASVGAGENIQAASAPLWYDVAGQKVAFLAASQMADLFFSHSYPRPFRATEKRPGIAPLESQWLCAAIGAVREKADLVVVSLHWGTEDSSKVTTDQRLLARQLIDAGADLILGHHPHVLQGLEFYKRRLIVYSLANCIFDQNDEANKEGMLLTLQYRGAQLQLVWALPIYMYEKGQAALAKDQKGETIRGKLIKFSEEFGTQCSQMGDAVYFSPPKREVPLPDESGTATKRFF